MIVQGLQLLLLIGAAQAAPAENPAGNSGMDRIAGTTQAAAQETDAGAALGVEPIVTLTPVEADAGEPAIGSQMVWRVIVDDSERSGGELVESPKFELEWALVDGPRSVPEHLTGGPVDFAAEWTLLPLEGGELSTPEVLFVFKDGTELRIPRVTVTLAHALGEEEDTYRPMPGFRDVDDRGVGNPRTALAVLIALFCLPLALFGVVRLRRRTTETGGSGDVETAVQAMESLDPKVDPVGTMARLAPLLRRAVEERLESSRPAATDEEWAAWIEEGADGASQETRCETGALMRVLTEVRFGGSAPTRFAAEEAKSKAIALVASPFWNSPQPASSDSASVGAEAPADEHGRDGVEDSDGKVSS